MIAESIGAVAGAILAAYLWEKRIRDRISVRRITSRGDADIRGVLDLYELLFVADAANYSPDDLLEFIDPTEAFSVKRHVRAENIVLVAKQHDDVVGILLCHFYPERAKGIISYHGVNPAVPAANASAGPLLLRLLRRILLRGGRKCDFLLFEIEEAPIRRTDGKRRRRNALFERFRINASGLGLRALRLEFPYHCPKVSLEETAEERLLDLVCIPIKAELPKPVPRLAVLDLLAFLHLDCYGDLYCTDDPRFPIYRQYLQGRVEHYRTTLPDAVDYSE
ncbi:MAG TPA: hypothetical protein VKK31_10680 [Thermoanaerobaculia bacterium]|nr:hypothetical protein [Thermoanaerobaculia bacterium]